ncbi:hypothetical protein [Clostridium sp. AM58-1XD]|uniref:hypothetical protein n=1 Tax=Clostridium sp. AM58-1XD TaxID=2292307 RepID=UPI000E48EBF1|nr:hypothetical protein [Clostridium sp. AM58-1XD]RGY98560.1 hypothetical protein DXA13_10790 [Clostridium sp. AM58-1XD]
MRRKVGTAVQLIDGFTMKPVELPSIVTSCDNRVPVRKKGAVWIFWESREAAGKILVESPFFFKQEQEFPVPVGGLQRIWMVPNTKYPYPSECDMSLTEKAGVPGEDIVLPLEGTEGNIWLAEDCRTESGTKEEPYISLVFTRGLEIWPDVLWIEADGKGEAVFLMGNSGYADEKRRSDGTIIRRFQLRKQLSVNYMADRAVCRFVYHTAVDGDGAYLIPRNLSNKLIYEME